VAYKYQGLLAKDKQIIVGLANMFLKCINHCTLESPSQKSKDDDKQYKVNYTRCFIVIMIMFIMASHIKLNAMFIKRNF